jgi:hypothetical protein
MDADERRRKGEIRDWCSSRAGCISELTGLVRDVIGLVAEYALIRAHLWCPLPANLRRHPCDPSNPLNEARFEARCQRPLAEPSSVFAACLCWAAFHQHTCSIYRLDESGSRSWRLHVQDTSNWWTGVLWAPTAENDSNLSQGFQPPTHKWSGVDSLFDIPRGKAVMLARNGDLYEWIWTSSRARKLRNVDCRGVSHIDIQIDSDHELLFRFPDGRADVRVRTVAALGSARPFVQLTSGRPDSVSIETLDASTLFSK